jgi:DNA-binding NarL/FixJ family response regulator
MLKLILADNQAIFRAGIAKVLAVEDEMRIVAQAQTAEQMFMALDKFRAAVLIIAGGFHSDFNAVLSASNKNKTRVVVLADTGESAQRYMAAGAHGVVYRNVTSPALVDCVRKIARGESWVQDMAVPSELTENDMVGLRVRDRLTAKELRKLLAHAFCLREQVEIIRATRFRIGSRHIEAAERMRAHHRSRALAVQVKIADVELLHRAIEFLARTGIDRARSVQTPCRWQFRARDRSCAT